MKRTTSLLVKEKYFLKRESDIQGKLVTSEELLKDGSSKKGDLIGASIAQMMIATATSKIEKLRREVDKLSERKSETGGKGEKKLLENKLAGCPLVREKSGKFVFSSRSGKSQGILKNGQGISKI